MYMAIFSGGRWIRQQLADAGPDFELAFLSFDGDEDGEDLKRDFKAGLARAEEMLSPQERQEVVEEAQALFGRCIALVAVLDREVRWQYVRQVATRGVLAFCILWLLCSVFMGGHI